MAHQVVVKNRIQLADETADALRESGHHNAVDPNGLGASYFCERTGFKLHSVGFDAQGHPQTWVFAKG